jgi:DNA polymerase
MNINEKNAKKFLRALKDMGVDSYVFDKKGAPGLDGLEQEIKKCAKCGLAKTRKNVVPGEGNKRARLVFVGEAPGEDEDLQGRPFVGRAGKLLDQLIERTGLKRSDVYICNVLKCRPPNNRDPEPEEVAACRQYLMDQIRLIKPKVICTLGRHAYNTMLNVDEKITRIRGKLITYEGRKLLPTYHPSYLLRNQTRINEAWEDMETLRKLLK